MKTKTTNKPTVSKTTCFIIKSEIGSFFNSLLHSIFLTAHHLSSTRSELVSPCWNEKGKDERGELHSLQQNRFLSLLLFICNSKLSWPLTVLLIHWFEKEGLTSFLFFLKKKRRQGTWSYIISFFGCSLNTFTLPKPAVRVGKRG